MANVYKNLIFTNHALTRLSQRRIEKEAAFGAFANPDKKEKKGDGTTTFVKKIDKHTVTILAKQNEKSEWIALSAWIDPPIPGTKDEKLKLEYRKYQKSGFWGKLFYIVKKQIIGH